MSEEKTLLKITRADDICSVEIHASDQGDTMALAINLISVLRRHPQLFSIMDDIISKHWEDKLWDTTEIEIPDFNEILKNLK